MPDGPADATDQELLSRHVAGDPEAFGELVRRHRDRLWALALRTLGDQEDAADALQEGLVSAFRKADTFRGDSAVTTWLHRIVVNACLDRMRRNAARPTIPLSDVLDNHSGSRVDPSGTWADATDVTAALARLPREQRLALVLVDMQGHSVEETASILGVARGTVKSRCARGRAALAPLLTDADGGGTSTGAAGEAGRAGNQPGSGHVPPARDRERGGEGGS